MVTEAPIPRTLDEAIADTKTVYVIGYTGLGDTILLAPILDYLNQCYPGRVLFPDNPMLSALRTLGIGTLVKPTNPDFRKLFGPEHYEEALDRFLDQENVGAILYLRRDSVYSAEQMIEAQERLKEKGITVWDMCAGQSEYNRIHTYELARSCLNSANMEAPESPSGWLKPYYNATNDKTSNVMIYTGSGQPHKRWPPAQWARLIRSLMEASHTVSILSGVSPEERRAGRELLQLLHSEGFFPRSLSCGAGTQVAQYIREHTRIITADTYIVHLSSALDVPVLGIYLATDPTIYGPIGRGKVILSPYYYRCPRRTLLGNCDAWENGCKERHCLHELNPTDVSDMVLEWINQEV